MCNFAEEEQATGGAIALCCFVALCSFDSKRNRQEGAVDFALLSFDPACFLSCLPFAFSSLIVDLRLYFPCKSNSKFCGAALRGCTIGLN